MTESPSSLDISTKLDRIAKQAKEIRDAGLQTLAHYIDVTWLREAYRRARKDGALGVDVCGGVVHSASYARKPRGAPADLDAECERRLSFCCAAANCRKRVTSASVRFLKRKVYHGAVVVLATALRHGSTPRRAAPLRELFGVSAKTLARWRSWWREVFAESPKWRAAQSRFARPVPTSALPASLLERFAGDVKEQLVSTLRFLAPLTVSDGRG
jgi:hypothetical protein